MYDVERQISIDINYLGGLVTVYVNCEKLFEKTLDSVDETVVADVDKDETVVYFKDYVSSSYVNILASN